VRDQSISPAEALADSVGDTLAHVRAQVYALSDIMNIAGRSRHDLERRLLLSIRAGLDDLAKAELSAISSGQRN
jgi:phage shock protein A